MLVAFLRRLGIIVFRLSRFHSSVEHDRLHHF
jgi:hypothetical protein